MAEERWSLVHPPKRTPASDACYAALGRALEVAGGFSAWCLVLSTLSGAPPQHTPFEHPGLPGDEAIERVVALLRARNPVERSGPGPEYLDGDVSSVVEFGQRCYRTLLDGIAPGLPERLRSADGRLKFLEELGELTRGVAHATSLVATLAFMLEEQPILSDAEGAAYVRAVVGWVCNPRDRAGE